MTKLVIGVATMRKRISGIAPGDIPLALSQAITSPTLCVRYNTPSDNLGVVGSYQWIYEHTTEDIIALLHDDLLVRERGWDERVLREFDDPQVALVGFGGALQHGAPEIYRVPYQLQQLQRYGYRSNVDDAEVHGERFTEACDAAVLDGYCLIVRRSLLDRIGGFSRFQCDFFNYDYALCAFARRYGLRIRCVGIRCHHRGGGTSVGKDAQEITSQEAYDKAHRWFYEEFRDVLPAKVNL